MITTFIAMWLVPPLALLVGLTVGYLLLRHRARAGRLLLVGSGCLLAVVSMPYVGSLLLSSIEPAFEDPLLTPADAIVVLGGGSYSAAQEYGGDTVNSFSLERLRYAARLYGRSGKPVLVSGGNPLGNATSEASQMRAVLEHEWRLPVAWSEERSANTMENARESFAVLSRAGVQRIYLVTHAWHMPRARFAFERAGFTVVAAPTRYTVRRHYGALAFLPSAEGLQQSALFCREILGLLWYRLKS